MDRAGNVLKHAALVSFGLTLGLVILELGLRATAWVLVRTRTPVRLASGLEPGTIRILCLGESTTFDMGGSNHNSYPAQLEEILNARANDRRYVVINGGVPATTTDRIAATLEEKLDKFRPDVVVTMMGTNDGPPDDPVFPVYESLRVLKLARLLAATVEAVLRGGHRADADAIDEIPRVDGRVLPQAPRSEAMKLYFASLHVLGRRFDDAERMLAPLANRPVDDPDGRSIAITATGQLVLLYHQWGREDDALRHHRRYLELGGALPNPRTATNYRTLQRLLDARGLPLVAVQYPGRSLEPLRQLLAGARNVVFVDNEEAFLRLAKERPLTETYRDLFAGIFGHMTPAGNRILATNVAAAIEGVVGVSGARSD